MTAIALVVVSDGRVDYLHETLASLEANSPVAFDPCILVDDSGLLPVYLRLQQEFPEFCIIHHKRRSGVAAAVQSGWDAALESDCEYVFHLEQDFTFNGPIPIAEMVAILDRTPELAHLVLKRDPYSPVEIAAGDFMRVDPDRYHDRDGWVEVDGIFSCNPSLIRRKAIEVGPFSQEASFAETLERAGFRCAFYGKTTDAPRVTHIGEFRALGWKP